MNDQRRSPAADFIRGGQTTQHWVRMALQVLRYAIVASILAGAVAMTAQFVRTYDHRDFVMSRYWMWSRVVSNRPASTVDTRITIPPGDEIIMSWREINGHPAFRDAYYRMESRAWDAGIVGAVLAIAAFGLAITVFAISGARFGKTRHVRGARLVDLAGLRRWSSEEWLKARAWMKDWRNAPRYKLAGVEFPPQGPEGQTGIFATTGAGKTTIVKELLHSVRAAGTRAIIYDRTGSLTALFYDESRDIILNPFDARSHCWSPFHDAESSEAFAKIYEVLIPQKADERDAFWKDAARIVAESASKVLLANGRRNNSALRTAIMTLPLKQLEAMLARTPATRILNDQSGKMGMSVLATMLTHLRFLEYLRDDGPDFSVRKWVKEGRGEGGDGGFLFLTGHAEHDTATRAVASAVMEIAANALMAAGPSNGPELFFVVDELPSLNRLPFLTGKLAEVRQVGGCFVLGFQVLSQLEEIYGRAGARSILGNLNNICIGTTPDAETAKLFSDALGKTDQIESRETVSVGVESVRDGNSRQDQRTERELVTASEVQNLRRLEFYLRFSFGSPTAMVKLKRPTQEKPVAAARIDYNGPGFALGTLDPDLFSKRVQFLEMTDAERGAEFISWLERIGRRDPSSDDAQRFGLQDHKALWAHFGAARLQGRLPNEIAPPAQPPEMKAAGTNSTSRVLPPDDLPPYPFGSADPQSNTRDPSNGVPCTTTPHVDPAMDAPPDPHCHKQTGGAPNPPEARDPSDLASLEAAAFGSAGPETLPLFQDPPASDACSTSTPQDVMPEATPPDQNRNGSGGGPNSEAPAQDRVLSPLAERALAGAKGRAPAAPQSQQPTKGAASIPQRSVRISDLDGEIV